MIAPFYLPNVFDPKGNEHADLIEQEKCHVPLWESECAQMIEFEFSSKWPRKQRKCICDKHALGIAY